MVEGIERLVTPFMFAAQHTWNLMLVIMACNWRLADTIVGWHLNIDLALSAVLQMLPPSSL